MLCMTTTQHTEHLVTAIKQRHPSTLAVAHATLGRLVAIQSEVKDMSDTLLAQRIEEATLRLMGDERSSNETILLHTVLQAEWKRRKRNVATL